MKICFICYHLSDGGAQRVVSVLSAGLAENNDVLIVVKERTEKEYPIDERIRILTMDDDPGFRASKHKDLAAIPVLRRIFRAEEPDFVLNFLGFTEAGYLASVGLRKTRYIPAIRNSPWSKPESKLRRMTRDLTIMLSQACMIQNLEQGTYFPGWIQKKLFVIHNPVDPKFLEHQDHAFRPVRKIITLGRLHEQKNHEMLVRAFARIADRAGDTCLEIYGDGSRKEALLKLAAELGIGERVSIMPFTQDSISVYDSGDLFVLSSNFEGSPNALLEAMALGLPCISTDCRTGPREIIADGENGLLVQTGNSDQLAEKMLYLIQHPEKCEALGRQARETIRQQYAREQVVQSLEEALQKRLR